MRYRTLFQLKAHSLGFNFEGEWVVQASLWVLKKLDEVVGSTPNKLKVGERGYSQENFLKDHQSTQCILYMQAWRENTKSLRGGGTPYWHSSASMIELNLRLENGCLTMMGVDICQYLKQLIFQKQINKSSYQFCILAWGGWWWWWTLSLNPNIGTAFAGPKLGEVTFL